MSEQTPLNLSPLKLSGVTSSQTLRFNGARAHNFESIVLEWMNEPDTYEEDRAQAAWQILCAVLQEARILNLTGLRLSSLPDLAFLESVENLDLSKNNLTTLANYNLPPNLQILCIVKNKLVSLPQKKPDGLRDVYLSENPSLLLADVIRWKPRDLALNNSSADVWLIGNQGEFKTYQEYLEETEIINSDPEESNFQKQQVNKPLAYPGNYIPVRQKYKRTTSNTSGAVNEGGAGVTRPEKKESGTINTVNTKLRINAFPDENEVDLKDAREISKEKMLRLLFSDWFLLKINALNSDNNASAGCYITTDIGNDITEYGNEFNRVYSTSGLDEDEDEDEKIVTDGAESYRVSEIESRLFEPAIAALEPAILKEERGRDFAAFCFNLSRSSAAVSPEFRIKFYKWLNQLALNKQLRQDVFRYVADLRFNTPDEAMACLNNMEAFK